MMRRPPGSTRFPYATVFRSDRAASLEAERAGGHLHRPWGVQRHADCAGAGAAGLAQRPLVDEGAGRDAVEEDRRVVGNADPGGTRLISSTSQVSYASCSFQN